MPRQVAASSDDEGSGREEEQEDNNAANVVKNPQRALQHMFLQTFLSRRTMTDAQAKRILVKCAKLAKGELLSRVDGARAREGTADARRVQSGTRTRSPSRITSVTWSPLSPHVDSRSSVGTTSRRKK